MTEEKARTCSISSCAASSVASTTKINETFPAPTVCFKK